MEFIRNVSLANCNWEFFIKFKENVLENININFLNIINENINYLVNKINWRKEEVTVSYIIPEKLKELDTADLIRFLIENIFKSLRVELKTDEGKELISFNGLIKEEPDWFIEFPENTDKIVLNITYKISQTICS